MEKLTITISRKRGVLSGKWCLDDTRISVETLIMYKNLKDILRDYPHLKDKIVRLSN